jgi:hypothetical protein
MLYDAGLGGWTEGFLAEGYDVVGFDVEQHVYGEQRYPAQLVLQDVLTLNGRQFKDAACIVASSPCQEYSYMAMPWQRAKKIAKALRGRGEFPDGYTGSRTMDELNALFLAPARIQREASEAAGRWIPMVQENVCGAQPWVGNAAWHYGPYYLWGDVPALMPIPSEAIKVATMGAGWYPPGHPKHVPGLGFNTHADRATRALSDGVKAGDRNKGRANGGHAWTTDFEEAGIKNTGGSWFNVAHNTTSGHGQDPDGRKVGGSWFYDNAPGPIRSANSKSTARKAASARIAKIPAALAQHIAHCFYVSMTERVA